MNLKILDYDATTKNNPVATASHQGDNITALTAAGQEFLLLNKRLFVITQLPKKKRDNYWCSGCQYAMSLVAYVRYPSPG